MALNSTRGSPPSAKKSKSGSLVKKDNGREAIASCNKREKINQDKIFRPLRKIIPKPPGIQNSQDPREGALAEEIRQMRSEEVREMNAEQSRMLGNDTAATATPVIVETPATDSSLDGEYSTDDEYVNTINNEGLFHSPSTDKAAAGPAESTNIGTQSLHGRLRPPRALSPPPSITGFGPAVATIVASEWNVNHEYHAGILIPSKIIEQNNAAMHLLAQASPPQVPSQPLPQPRRSPRRHVRRGVAEPPKRRSPAGRRFLTGLGSTRGRTGTGENPLNTHTQGEGTFTQVAGATNNGRPTKIIIKFGGGPTDAVPEVKNGKQVHHEGTNGDFRPEDDASTVQGVIIPEAVRDMDHDTIHPTLLVDHLDPDRDGVLWDRQVDLWCARLLGNITPDAAAFRNAYDPIHPVDPYPPLSLGGYSGAGGRTSVNDDIPWDPNAPDGHSTQTFKGEVLEEVVEMLQAGGARNQVIHSTYHQKPNDYTSNHDLVASTWTGMPIMYDWTLYGHGNEDIELPASDAFGYYLVENDSQGKPVRKFHPYTDQDWNNAAYESGPPLSKSTSDP